MFLIALKDKTINDSKTFKKFKERNFETDRVFQNFLMYSIANIAKRQDHKIIVSSLSVDIYCKITLQLKLHNDETKYFYIIVTRFSLRAKFPGKINYHLDAGCELPCRKIY